MDNWSLTGERTSKKITWSTGEYRENLGAPTRFQIVIVDVLEDTKLQALGGTKWRARATLQVDIYVKVPDITNAGRASARADLWALREEARSILLTNPTGNTDIHVILPNPGRPLHEQKDRNPIYRWTYDIDVQYVVTVS